MWFDDADLWWVRHRPRVPGGEPARVARSEIVGVGLSEGDRAVVVSTADGMEHPLTDLGTPADRIALVAALGERVAPEGIRVHPASPLTLPRRWRSRASGTTAIWRPPHRLRPWAVGAGAAASTVAGVLLATRVSGEWATLLGFLAMCGAFVLVFRESAPSGRGWLVGNGRLEAVEVRAWSGEVMGTPQRVTALEVRPNRRGARLDAVLDDGRRVTVVAGRADRVAAVAGWLGERADLPLTQAGGGVIGMTVASEQVNR